MIIAQTKMADDISSSDVGDRCPFPGPFAPDFSACSSYQAVTFTAADSSNRPLNTWLTCRHLTTGKNHEEPGGFYPQCSLGATANRLNWLALVGRARLEVVRAIQEEFDSFSAPHRDELRRAKAELLDSPPSAGRAKPIDQRIKDFLQAVEAFMEQRRQRLDEVGLPVEPLLQLIEESCWAWARSRDAGSASITERRLAVFGPAAQAFLASALTSPWRRQTTGQVIFEQGQLRITRVAEPPGLRLDGAIDASNLDAVSTALDSALGDLGDVNLDLAGVLFCDLGGIRTLVRAAEAMSGGARLVLHNVPDHVERAMQVAGWSGLPAVVVAGGQAGYALREPDRR